MKRRENTPAKDKPIGTSPQADEPMPFAYLGPSLVKLANLEPLPLADFEKVSWRNAVSFFGLDRS